MEMGKANLRKINISTEIYVKNTKEKNHRGGERFHHDSDYNGISLEC